jgi:N-acetylglucosamine kinase-like BadF-type ATPase/DNA-binding XRE family transcriptional regulator
MYSQKALSTNIRYHRIRLGLSQKAVAEKLGVSVQAVSKWERGFAAPEIYALCGLAALFDISVDALLSAFVAPESAPAFIGVDGGGGKTEFVLFTSAGEVLGRELLSATNPNSVGIDRTCSVLKEGIDKLLPLARNGVKGIHLGIAGIPQGARREYIARYLSAAYPQISSRVSGDVDNVLASCDGVECGVFATVGSGSCVFVKTESETRGFGGGGYLLDEGGSGFDLGREAMRAVLYAEQGLGEKTLLSDLVNEKLGARLLLCITELYAGAPRSISSLAPLVFSAVRAGDAVAERIVKKSFEALADCIALARDITGAGDTLVFSGGLLNASELWMPHLLARLPYRPSIVIPRLPQIYGACRLALKEFGGGEMLPETRYIEEYERLKRSQSAFSSI